jgi:hypothetical protein
MLVVSHDQGSGQPSIDLRRITFQAFAEAGERTRALAIGAIATLLDIPSPSQMLMVPLGRIPTERCDHTRRSCADSCG